MSRPFLARAWRGVTLLRDGGVLRHDGLRLALWPGTHNLAGLQHLLCAGEGSIGGDPGRQPDARLAIGEQSSRDEVEHSGAALLDCLGAGCVGARQEFEAQWRSEEVMNDGADG